jgi:predicted N-acyltransferase
MGNDQKKINSIINKESGGYTISESKNNLLYKYYTQLTLNEPYLTKDYFSKLIKIYDEAILDELFSLFCSKKDKMSFTDLQHFYIFFKNPKLKYILFSFIFFGKQSKITKDIFVNKAIS